MIEDGTSRWRPHGATADGRATGHVWPYLRLLAADRILQAVAAAFGVALFVLVAAGAGVDALSPGVELVHPVFLGLIIAALLLGRERLSSRLESRFWGLLALAWMCWLIVDFFYLLSFFIEPATTIVSASFLTDVLYVLFYLVFALAIDQRPHLDWQPSLRLLRRRLESAAGLLAVFGVLTYFAIVVLPEPLGLSLSFVSREYGLTPQLLVRISLDLLLLGRLAHAALSSRGRWSWLYALLCAAMLLTALRDVFSLLQYENVVPVQGLRVLQELFVFLPGLVTVVAARARHLPDPGAAGEEPVDPENQRAAAHHTPLALYALAVPIVHFAFFPLGLLDPETRAPREVFCLIYMAILGAVAWVHQAVLDRDRREAHSSLREAEERLIRSQRLESIGRLAGGIAHDFNNYLTVIRCWSELLRERVRSADARSQIGHIESAAGKAADLTRQLLAIGRRQVLRPEALDLNAVILETGEMLRSLLGEDVKLELDLDPGVEAVRADRGQTEQVLMNLAVNSRDAMTGGGTLTLSTRRHVLRGKAASRLGLKPGTYVDLSVSDTGCGMTKEVREKAFEPFFTTRDSGEGTGLGLPTVYGIVKQSGGAISVDSAPEAGTSVRILLPTTEAPSRTGVGSLTRRTDEDSGATLLVVEDQDEVRRLAVRILERGGFRVLQAAGGREATAVFDEHSESIDLVVADVVMPEVDGAELVTTLLSRRPGLRAMFVSGYPAEIRRQRRVSLPTSIPLLQKPFTASTLTAAVRDALRAPPPDLESARSGLEAESA